MTYLSSFKLLIWSYWIPQNVHKIHVNKWDFKLHTYYVNLYKFKSFHKIWTLAQSKCFIMNDKLCLSNDPSIRAEAMKRCSKLVHGSFLFHISKFSNCTETVWLILCNVIFSPVWLKPVLSQHVVVWDHLIQDCIYVCVWCTLLDSQTPAVCSPCTVPPQRNADWQSQLAAVIYRELSAVGSPLPHLTHGMRYAFCLRNIHK